MAFYRKYRPQTLDEIIGQDSIKEALLSSHNSGNFSHAYLFCGPRGTGKTSTARILAKIINCENQKDGTIPCNKCDSCLSITNGSNLDLIEIDAASNRGIDDIRELRERIKLSPSSSKKKVYIIDEVHMLTQEAFNALLKTLEEPPEHALFILATTEPHKIPSTILSRVQRFDFKSAKIEDLVSALKNIAEKEKIKIDDPSLKLIAKKADGSFRDSHKLLEQLAALNKEITTSLIEQNLNSGKFEDGLTLLENIFEKNSQKSLETIENLTQTDLNIKEFVNLLLDTLRLMLFIKNGLEETAKSNLGTERFNLVQKLADKTDTMNLINILENLHKAQERMKTASITSLPLEIAAVESCTTGLDERVAEAGTPRRVSAAIEMIDIKQDIPEVSQDNPSSKDMELLKDKWLFILETIRPYNYSLEALLKQVKILNCGEGNLMLEVPYAFHQRILETPKSRDLLESVLTDVLGKNIKVNCVIGVRPVKIEELANIELAADDDIIRVASEIFNS